MGKRGGGHWTVLCEKINWGTFLFHFSISLYLSSLLSKWPCYCVLVAPAASVTDGTAVTSRDRSLHMQYGGSVTGFWHGPGRMTASDCSQVESGNCWRPGVGWIQHCTHTHTHIHTHTHRHRHHAAYEHTHSFSLTHTLSLLLFHRHVCTNTHSFSLTYTKSHTHGHPGVSLHASLHCRAVRAQAGFI